LKIVALKMGKTVRMPAKVATMWTLLFDPPRNETAVCASGPGISRLPQGIGAKFLGEALCSSWGGASFWEIR
jgi:hypothetical protein